MERRRDRWRRPAPKRPTRWLALIAGVALAFGVGLADVATGYEINLGLFYLVPIALVTWAAGSAAGLALSITSVAGLFIVDNFVTRDMPFPSHDLIPLWNALIRLGYFCVFTMILSALRRAHENERLLARQDHLTGIANQQAFSEASRSAIDRARRLDQPFSLAFIDCDNFKQINDSLGHAAGNRLLRTVAETMVSRVRPGDCVARVGGDEFALLLPGAGEPTAAEIVRDVRKALDATMSERGWDVTFSIGLVTFLTPPDSIDQAIHDSDHAMYAVKGSGKNSVIHRVVDRRLSG